MESKVNSKIEVPVFLRVNVENSQIVQWQEYLDTTVAPPQLKSVFCIGKAVLADGNDQTIAGPEEIIVRLDSELPPTSLHILARLLEPFVGIFNFDGMGTYTLNPTYAEIRFTQVLAVNIQPLFSNARPKMVKPPKAPKAKGKSPAV